MEVSREVGEKEMRGALGSPQPRPAIDRTPKCGEFILDPPTPLEETSYPQTAFFSKEAQGPQKPTPPYLPSASFFLPTMN